MALKVSGRMSHLEPPKKRGNNLEVKQTVPSNTFGHCNPLIPGRLETDVCFSSEFLSMFDPLKSKLVMMSGLN